VIAGGAVFFFFQIFFSPDVGGGPPNPGFFFHQDLPFTPAAKRSSARDDRYRANQGYAVRATSWSPQTSPRGSHEKEGIAKDRPFVYCHLVIAPLSGQRKLNAAGLWTGANLDGSSFIAPTRGNRLWLKENCSKSAPYDKNLGSLLNPNDRFRWNAEIAA